MICYRREGDIDVEVSASGFVKELEQEQEENQFEEFDEEFDEPSDEKRISQEEDDTKEGHPDGEAPNNINMVNEVLNKSESDKEEAPVEVEVKSTENLVVNAQEEPKHPVTDQLSDEDEAAEHPAFPEPYQGEGDEVGELAAVVEDWSGIRTRTKGTSSVTSMSTIHPDIIKARVKKTITHQQLTQSLQRIRAKGEANAVTRKKRANKEQCRPGGIWGWDN